MSRLVFIAVLVALGIGFVLRHVFSITEGTDIEHVEGLRRRYGNDE